MKRLISISLCFIILTLPVASAFGESGDYGTQKQLQEHYLITKAEKEDVSKVETNTKRVVNKDRVIKKSGGSGSGVSLGLLFLPAATGSYEKEEFGNVLRLIGGIGTIWIFYDAFFPIKIMEGDSIEDKKILDKKINKRETITLVLHILLLGGGLVYLSY